MINSFKDQINKFNPKIIEEKKEEYTKISPMVMETEFGDNKAIQIMHDIDDISETPSLFKTDSEEIVEPANIDYSISEEIIKPKNTKKYSSDNQQTINEIKKELSRLKITDPKMVDFVLKLAESESSFNPNAEVTSTRAKGLFQFTPALIQELGYRDNKTIFSIPTQVQMLVKSIEKNKDYFKDLLAKNQKLNIYGVLAGAHLGGRVGMEKYINSGYNPEDNLGTSLSDYYKKFSI